jgi:hypothetical protein
VQLAFYKGRGSLFDQLIAWWTRGAYSHVELVFHGPDGSSQWFSSSPRDGGARFTQVRPDAGKWEFLELPMPAPTRQQLLAACRQLVGRPYDWRAIFFSQFLPLKRQRREAWFCSEICLDRLQQVRWADPALPAAAVHPNALYWLTRSYLHTPGQ